MGVTNKKGLLWEWGDKDEQLTSRMSKLGKSYFSRNGLIAGARPRGVRISVLHY